MGLKVALLGYMGSGKSAVGNALAEQLDIDFVDLDTYIEAKEECSISDIFQRRGELYFRRKESYYLNMALKEKNSFVLALGGGTPCYGNNMEVVLANTKASIYLKMNVTELVHRLVQEKEQRPIIAAITADELPEFIGKHLFERNIYYDQASHSIQVKTKSIGELVNEIIGILN